MAGKVNLETLVCALKGHCTPAASVAALRVEEAGFGIDVAPTWRISRCLRCGVWLGGPPPTTPERDSLPAFEELDRPRRGKALRQAVILRLIAIERGIHCVIFAAIAIGGFVLRANLAAAQGAVSRFVQNLARQESQSGHNNTSNFVSREGTKFLHLKSGTLELLIVTAAIYAVVEGTEAVGLWHEKRWAEYLTALATAGFLPFEIYDLTKGVTVLRLGALIVNLAVLVYLVYAKHLFGVGRHRVAAPEESMAVERQAFFPPYEKNGG